MIQEFRFFPSPFYLYRVGDLLVQPSAHVVVAGQEAHHGVVQATKAVQLDLLGNIIRFKVSKNNFCCANMFLTCPRQSATAEAVEASKPISPSPTDDGWKACSELSASKQNRIVFMKLFATGYIRRGALTC